MLEDMALAVTLPAGRSGQLNVQSQHKIQLCNSHRAGAYRQASCLERSGLFLENVYASSCQAVSPKGMEELGD